MTIYKSPESINLDAGDVGVIIKSDGSTQVISATPGREFDAEKTQDKDLLSIVIALNHPVVMDLLRDIANDPVICEAMKEKLA